jgi:hypothetical protein
MRRKGKIICLILTVSLCSCFYQKASSQTVQLDSAINQISIELKSQFNRPNRNIAVLGFYGKINVSSLNFYLKNELAGKLAGSNISIIDQSVVDAVVADVAWSPAYKTDITTYYKISRSIFEQTNKSVSYFLYGTVSDQDSSISLNICVIEDESYAERSVLKFNIEATEQTDKLLGKSVIRVKKVGSTQQSPEKTEANHHNI